MHEIFIHGTRRAPKFTNVTHSGHSARVCRKFKALLNIEKSSEIYNGGKDDVSREFVCETERNNCIGFSKKLKGCRYIQLIWQIFFYEKKGEDIINFEVFTM